MGSEQYYDDIIELDLSTLEPHINDPFTPYLAHPITKFKQNVEGSSWPSKISCGLIGSCTNSSYEDLQKVQDLVVQARQAGLKRTKIPLLVSPVSEQIRATAERNDILKTLRQAGDIVLSNSCGPCVGQRDRTDVDAKGAGKNSVIFSFNRNFAGRHDSNPSTHSFVTSPKLATAFTFVGNLTYNTITDDVSIPSMFGGCMTFRLSPPKSNELPPVFLTGEDHFQPPVVSNTSDLRVDIHPSSDKLQLLTPFDPWQTGQASYMSILIKVRGKCTTDNISPAGPWYKYRGHLENISNNMLLRATNAFLPDASSLQRIGKAKDSTDQSVKPVPQAAQNMKKASIRWCIIGDNNYGDGSSREHAALEPRYLGGVAIIAKSFARIHEINSKKQGMLPLTFDDPGDYEKIQDSDHITLFNVKDGKMQPGKQIAMQVVTKEGFK